MQIWGFDQLLGALYVQVPLRMTVVRLAPADAPPSLLVFAPISPTEVRPPPCAARVRARRGAGVTRRGAQECLRLVRELEAQHGPVRNIVLSSPAIEHKAPPLEPLQRPRRRPLRGADACCGARARGQVAAGPFARNFPEAQLWVAPDQYSFPPGLDNLGLLGATQLFWGLRPRPLPPSAAGTPWVGEMEHALLGPLRSRGGDAPGLFEDVAMVHRRSRTLLVTDLVQTVPREIPAVLADDPRALLFHARDDAFARVEDSPATRQRGWERIALFSLFFQPGGVDVVPWAQAIPDAARSQMGELGWGGLFPFTWRPRAGPHPPEKAYYKESFEALAGECFVPAVLQSLILDREPARVLAFADAVARWDFAQIVPAHLGAPIPAGPREWRRAFAFLEDGDAEFPGDLERPPLAGDARFLRDISQSLADKAPPPPPPPAAPGARAEAARARRGWSRRRTRRSRLRGSAAACAAAYRLGVALWNTQPALDSPQPTPQVLTRGVRAGRPHRAPATAGGRSVTSR